MVYDYSDLQTQIQQWTQQAITQHWLAADDVAPLLELTTDSLTTLSITAPSQPLIVAFMGGTGVGKSSLLNRLAGSAIAKVGLERPTSREVTLYHHQGLILQQLPVDLPLQSIRIAQHNDAQKSNILWLDMPDFDSTEQRNKQLVLQWLPHIDVLIYVVSPERYKDHKAWQLLLAEGAKHGWLFVLNQWDKGSIAQYDDFIHQLNKAGFTQPLIFRTACIETTVADEFNQLLGNIVTLSSASNVKQLAQHQYYIKKQQLKKELQHCKNLFAPASAFQQLSEHWQKQWSQTTQQLTQGFDWTLQQYANRYARSHSDIMVRQQPLLLWDEWAQNRLDDVLNSLILTADPLHIALIPLQERLYSLRQQAGKTLEQQTELYGRCALSKPGNALQRGLLKTVAVCAVLLPLSALCAVAYQVFVGYYQSYLSHKDYLGVDFAAHSSLLILISWLLPYFLQKNLQPSLEKAALRGLKKGLATGLLSIEAEVKQALELHQQQHLQKISQLNQYITACDLHEPSATLTQNGTLARALLNT